MSRARKRYRILSLVAGGLVALALAGCPKQEEQAGGEKAPPAASEPTAEVTAALAKADTADGTTDQVVSKCVTCNFGMEGKADFASKVGEYQVHLCSEDCKKSFDADPSKAILALKIPEGSEK